MTFTHALSTNNYGPAAFIVDATTSNGTHSTIASAITAAVSGQTIFIKPGTYTENLTLKAGVNLTAYGSDSSLNGTGNVIISGTCTLTAAGSVTISGIQLQTNSAALLAVTGSAASIVNLQNCYLNCTNATGITFSSSSASAAINIYNCNGNLGTTGIAYFSDSSAGNLNIAFSKLSNTGASTTASTKSAGGLGLSYTDMASPLAYSSSNAASGCTFSYFNTGNTACITTSGTGSFLVIGTYLVSGTASSISAGAGTTVYCHSSTIASSNTNAITGAGSVVYSGLTFNGASSTINTTTQTGSGTLQGSKNTAPSAGFLGEQIRSALASGSSVSMADNVAKTITSISLTAGIWDVSGFVIYNGTSGGGINIHCSVSTTTNTLGTDGDADIANGYGPVSGSTGASVANPSYRLTLSSTTTVYLVGQIDITSGTMTAYGRISATRVG